MVKKSIKAIQKKIEEIIIDNKNKIIQEVKETKELYQLLIKRSKGQRWTTVEAKAVKEQLIDICKTIPALAIFMVPFGSIVILLLIKFLPFNILPSSFAKPHKKDLHIKKEEHKTHHHHQHKN